MSDQTTDAANEPAREYWPADYGDEIMPEGRVSAQAWVTQTEAGWMLAPGFVDDDDEKRAPAETGIKIGNGDTIEFIWSRRLPDIDVTFYPDGTYFVHGSFDPAASWFWCQSENEICGDTSDELNRNFAAAAAYEDDGSRETVGSTANGSETYRVVIDKAGCRLELLPAAPTTAAEQA